MSEQSKTKTMHPITDAVVKKSMSQSEDTLAEDLLIHARLQETELTQAREEVEKLKLERDAALIARDFANASNDTLRAENAELRAKGRE